MKLQTVRGMRDILPEEQKYWRYARSKFNITAKSLGFLELTIPVVEYGKLFRRSIGESTDIVEKELFVIPASKEEDTDLALRPEFTAGCVRSYIENGMRSWPQPVMLYLSGPAFRRERPQKNRYRQFFQLDLEIIGDDKPKYDLLIIQTSLIFLQSLGLKDLKITLNSIGCQKCRPGFRDKLVRYFQKKTAGLCKDCLRRLEKNPLRILDCKEVNCQKVAKAAPKIIDNLCLNCSTHFSELKQLLGDFGIIYEINANLVRGLDYYNRTVFEINTKDDAGRQSSLGGGGRFDYLFEMLGERSTPAVGVALGLDRIVNLLKKSKTEIPDKRPLKLMILGVGETEKECFNIYNQLLENNKIFFYLPSTDNLSKQLEFANKMQAEFVLIIGNNEVKSGKYILKNLATGKQKEIAGDALLTEIK